MVCTMVLYNGNPITVTPPFHVVLKIEYCEPGARGNTATNVSKPCKVETGAEFQCPVFVNIGDLIRIDTRTGEYLERAKDKRTMQRIRVTIHHNPDDPADDLRCAAPGQIFGHTRRLRSTRTAVFMARTEMLLR